jgi:glycosyltransferase involved in cell wall biosynthesis
MMAVQELPDGPARCQRFVFVGRVCDEKGVNLILQVARGLRARDMTVDIFGAVVPPYTAAYIESQGMGCVHYRGTVEFHRVPQILADYHALILPTVYEGEGYPGAILEAYGAGLPVIASAWRAIPEIVDEQCGLLIEPGSAPSLFQAMCQLNGQPALYDKLRAGVLRKRERFDEKVWTAQFLDWCRDLVAARHDMHNCT